jgi:hypothetical protein
MTPTQREQIRLSILRYCDSAGQYGLAAALLLQFIRREGFRALTPAQLNDEVEYLADKSFLTLVVKPISPENRAWRITAIGRDFFAAQHQEPT